MTETPRVEQSHLALSGPSPLPFRGAPEDRSQPWREGEALLDFGQLVGLGFKTRDPCALNASPWGKKVAGSQRETERLKWGKGPGFQLRQFVSPEVFCLCPGVLGSWCSEVRLLVQQLADV